MAITPGNGDEPYAADHPVNQSGPPVCVGVSGSVGAPRAAGSSGLITDPSSVQSSERSGGGWKGLIWILAA